MKTKETVKKMKEVAVPTSEIKIFDTTLRDGEQAPGYSMNLNEKVRMAKQLEKLGVDMIEAGFPVASDDDFEAVSAIAASCKKAEVVGLSRALEKDIKTCWEAIKGAKKPRIHTFIATSDIHLKHKLKMSKDEVLKMAVEAVKYAKSLCDRVDFSPEDATRSDKTFLYKVLTAVIDAGADTVNIPDTVGYTTPQEFYDLIKGIKENVPNIQQAVISVHCHNDLGLAVANSLSAVLAGAGQIQCTINGIGERAGNASLEELVMALKVRADFYRASTNINTKEIYPASRLLSKITGIGVQPNKAIVGANAFAHEAGIHQHGVLMYKQTYEIMTPEDIGLETSSLVLGKHSGKHALRDRLFQLGFEPSERELESLFVRFKNLADKKKEIYDEDLEMLVLGFEDPDMEAFKLVKVHSSSATDSTPVAAVTLVNEAGEKLTEANTGDGQIDAMYASINQITGVQAKLKDFKVFAATPDSDALAHVKVLVEFKGKSYSGYAADTDTIVACAKSYLNAVNKAYLYNR